MPKPQHSRQRVMESRVKNIEETLYEILQQFKNFDHKFTSLEGKYEQLAKEIYDKEVSSSSSTIQETELIQSNPNYESPSQIAEEIHEKEVPSSSMATIQAIQSSPNYESSSEILCEICVEKKETHEMFKNESCVHSFCSYCVTKYVASKIENHIPIVSCPGFDCKAVLDLETCRPLLPQEILERWEQALCEALVLGGQKIYCPFKDCSTALVIDIGQEDQVNVRETECPVCHRLFCAGCQVPWHSGVECEEFQRLNENERGRDSLMMKELAKEKQWQRCPRCKIYVEKTQGCLHITCRCQFHFCYRCGAEWTPNHGGCQSEGQMREEDPLNWSWKDGLTAFFLCCLFVLRFFFITSSPWGLS